MWDKMGQKGQKLPPFEKDFTIYIFFFFIYI